MISYEDLIQYKSEQACRAAGKVRLEGKIMLLKMVIFCILDLMFDCK